MAQLFSLGHFARHEIIQEIIQILFGWRDYLVFRVCRHWTLYFAVHLSHHVASFSFAAIVTYDFTRLVYGVCLAY